MSVNVNYKRWNYSAGHMITNMPKVSSRWGAGSSGDFIVKDCMQFLLAIEKAAEDIRLTIDRYKTKYLQ